MAVHRSFSIREDLGGQPVFPGGRQFGKSGLALYMKKLLPNGDKVNLSSLTKVQTEGRSPGEEERNPMGFALEGFSDLPEGNQWIPA